MKKGYKEGHSANVICNGPSSETLRICFRVRVESQTSNIKRLVDSVLSGNGEFSMLGLIAFADRSYVPLGVLKSFLMRGMSGGTIMLSFLLRCHSFAPESRFDVTRHDEETEKFCSIKSNTYDESVATNEEYGIGASTQTNERKNDEDR